MTHLTKQQILIAFLLLTGIIFRLIPHAPNFTPVLSIALFAGATFEKKYALFLPLSIMIISDLFIGLHDVIAFTWGAFLVTTLLGIKMRNNQTPITVLGNSFLSAILFFIITNLGVWLVGDWYPSTLSGLMEAFVMGIPFFRNTLISSIVYSVIFFGIYEFVIRIAESKVARETIS